MWLFRYNTQPYPATWLSTSGLPLRLGEADTTTVLAPLSKPPLRVFLEIRLRPTHHSEIGIGGPNLIPLTAGPVGPKFLIDCHTVSLALGPPGLVRTLEEQVSGDGST